jgi:hypothetical protein
LPPPRHVFCDRGLSDINAQLEQLAVYPGRAPEWICEAHLTDQAANLIRYRRPTKLGLQISESFLLRADGVIE